MKYTIAMGQGETVELTTAFVSGGRSNGTMTLNGNILNFSSASASDVFSPLLFIIAVG